MGWEVPLLDPSRAFVRVSAFGPSPHLLPDLPVHVRECILTAHMSVLVRPPPNDGIELTYHVGRGAGGVPFEDASGLGQYTLHGLPCWLDNQLIHYILGY